MERLPIQGTVTLLDDESGTARRFTHCTLMEGGRGGSILCYEARLNGRRGVLKEFYPKDQGRAFYALMRGEGQQLITAGVDIVGAKAQYAKDAAAYLATRLALQKTVNEQDSPAARELSTYLEPFLTLHGCSPAGTPLPSVYLWTEGRRKATFAHVIAQVRREPEIGAGEKLLALLEKTAELTRAICALHRCGYLHRDVKPGNFGFVKRGAGAESAMLTLFDLDSVCSLFARTPGEVAGTAEYLEPEAVAALQGRAWQPYLPGIQTDVYAIGRTLAEALLLPEIPRWAGDDTAFARQMRRALRSSRLIQAEANDLSGVTERLGEILIRSMSPRAARYADTDALLHALQALLGYLRPYALAGEGQAVRALRAHPKQALAAFQYHVYAHPLYECSPGDSMEIALLGFGSYGQRFLDVALQAGQMRGKRLRVRVISGRQAEELPRPAKACYLEERPLLPSFFRIDGQGPDIPQAYGEIGFIDADLPEAEGLEEALAALLFTGRRADYVMIALGRDGLNVAVANAVQRVAASRGKACSIHCALDSRLRPAALCPGVHAVHIRHADRAPARADVLRMALNLHRAWSGMSGPMAYAALKKEFQEPYNRSASCAAALSIRYKLKGLGVEWTDDPAQAADALAAKLLEGGQAILAELAEWEHRRWVTAYACQGWTCLTDVDQAPITGRKDSRLKRHACLVSTVPGDRLPPDSPLWDADAAALAASPLDELERVSVRLHQAYGRRARQERGSLSAFAFQEVRREIAHLPEALAALDSLQMALRGVLDGEISAARRFPACQSALLTALGQSDLDARAAARLTAVIETLARQAEPAVQHLLRVNYKTKDDRLVLDLPYILAHRPDAALLVPFDPDGDLLPAVTAPACLDPDHIVYLALLPSDDASRASCQRALARVLRFLRRRCHGEVSLLALYRGADPGALLSGLGLNRAACVPFDEGFPAAAAAALRGMLPRRAPLAAQRDGGALSALLAESGFYEAYPFFQLGADGALADGRGCGWVVHAPHGAHLPLADMLDLAGLDLRYLPPAFEGDHPRLWRICRRDPAAWASLCARLRDACAAQSALCCLRPGDAAPAERVYLLPPECHGAISALLPGLIAHGVLAPGSRAELLPGFCRLTALDQGDNAAAFAALLAHPERFDQEGRVQLHPEGDCLRLTCERLHLRGLAIPPSEQPLLAALAELGYLRLSEDALTFASPAVMQLLTDPAALPNLCLHEALKAHGGLPELRQGREVLHGGTPLPCAALAALGHRLAVIAWAEDAQSADALCALRDGALSGRHPLALLVTDAPDAAARAILTGIEAIAPVDDLPALADAICRALAAQGG